MKPKNHLDNIAASGIAADYINAHGEPQAVSLLTRQRLLAAMRPSSGVATPLPPVVIFRHRQPLILTPKIAAQTRWQLVSEAGKTGLVNV